MCDTFHYLCGLKTPYFVASFFTSSRVSASSLLCCNLKCGQSLWCHYVMAGWFKQYGIDRGLAELIQRLRAKPVCIVSSQPRVHKSPPTEIPLSSETQLTVWAFQTKYWRSPHHRPKWPCAGGVWGRHCFSSRPWWSLLFFFVFCYYPLRVNPPSS